LDNGDRIVGVGFAVAGGLAIYLLARQDRDQRLIARLALAAIFGLCLVFALSVLFPTLGR
jgi:hypothetical protein